MIFFKSDGLAYQPANPPYGGAVSNFSSYNLGGSTHPTLLLANQWQVKPKRVELTRCVTPKLDSLSELEIWYPDSTHHKFVG